MEFFFAWLLCAILSAATLSYYNKAGTGFLLGAILGPLGLCFALVIRSDEGKKRRDQELHTQRTDEIKRTSSKPATKTCQFCHEEIKAMAIKCKHCGSEIVPD